LNTENHQISTKNLSIGYSSKKQTTVIQKDINITIEKGSLVVLLGKNGAGKSTLLRTLCGVQKPVEGDVFIYQKNINDYSNLELAKTLGLVLTEKLPESQLTVFELIALGRQPYTNWIDKLSDNDIQKIEEAIELTEIEEFKNRRFYELSDGQLQRVLIARAIAQDTEIIVLDEPTAHLDIHHTYKIFSLLKNLVDKTGKTILLSTHEVNLSMQLGDNFILLNDNELHTGTASELIPKKAFHNLFPKDLIAFNTTLQQFVIKQK